MNDPEQLREQLGEIINEIKDDSIREFTFSMVTEAFLAWERPASRDHHLPDEREPYGNLLHSIRVASLCRLISNAVAVTLDDGTDGSDILLSAAILHDLCRYGLFGTAESPRPDHPKLVRLFAEEKNLTCDRFEEIMEAIESHMGRWSVNPVAFEIDAALALHLADCIVARWAEVVPGG